MYLLANVPPVKCFVRKEYLYNFEQGHGDFEPCVWISVKSIKGKALYIEALLTNYGAVYDKLPISAFVHHTDAPGELPLDFLQIWDCFSYNITILAKASLSKLRTQVFMKDKEMYEGEYMFTIDSCHSDPNELDTSLSQTPDEHKSFNIIKLDNGQFCAQPNNRVLFFDQSLTPNGTTIPDFKVSTKEFICEQSTKWVAGEDWSYQ